jgi:Cys-tRNA synthase (O-phospho-L-seryl-tRNA:Cys-tRNA synthase)
MAMGRANSARTRGPKPDQHYVVFRFSVFRYIAENWHKLQKFVENEMKLRKIQNKLP